MRSPLPLSVVAILPLVFHLGCPPPEPETPPPQRKPPPVSGPLEHRVLTVPVSLPGFPLEVDVLPSFPGFKDPRPLPARSLRRERALSAKAEGSERQSLLTDLAARLWALANVKIDQVRALETQGGTAAFPGIGAKIATLRREASAHLQECMALLEGVLETPDPPRLARLRLAHYLRELNPRSAVSHLRLLVADELEGPARDALGLDLAQLLLREGQVLDAAEVLQAFVKTDSTPRSRLLRALAYAAIDHAVRQEVILAALSDCASARPDQASPWTRHLPVLLASMARPAGVYQGLLGSPSACVGEAGPEIGARLVERLLHLGRASAARSVERVLTRASLDLPEALRRRLTEEAGPFPVRDVPPKDAVLLQRVRGHKGSVLVCARGLLPERGLRLVIRARPDGQVRLVSSQEEPRSGGSSRALLGQSSEPGGQAPRRSRWEGEGARVWRCLQEQVPRWRLGSWRAAVTLELTLTVIVTRNDRTPAPATDPG